MAIAENLKATQAVGETVRGVADNVVAIDNRVAGVGDRVASIDDRVKVVDDRVAEVIRGALIVFNQSQNYTQTLNYSDGKEAKRLSSSLVSADRGVLRILSEKELRESVHKWLSPPDPSTNHNIACDTHHKKTASWFFQGSIFQEWKSTGELLWVHGKRLPRPLLTWLPLILSWYCIAAGSGKSVLWFVVP